MIFIVIQAYHTTLAYLRLQIITLFSSKCNDDVLFLSLNHHYKYAHKYIKKQIKIFFLGRPDAKFAS